MKDIILFTHIGKTGGMSLHEILLARFPPDEMIGHKAERDFFYSVKYLALGQVGCISGHFGYGLHAMLPRTVRPLYVTILRDPFERLRSLYWYRPELREKVTFEQFVRSPNRWRNMMTEYVCGFAYEPSAALAMHRLARDYACFGITERFDESLDWICPTLNLGEPAYARLNITEDKPEMDEDERPRLRALLEAEDAEDFILYREANRIFDARRDPSGPSRFQELISNFPHCRETERDGTRPISKASLAMGYRD